MHLNLRKDGEWEDTMGFQIYGLNMRTTTDDELRLRPCQKFKMPPKWGPHYETQWRRVLKWSQMVQLLLLLDISLMAFIWLLRKQEQNCLMTEKWMNEWRKETVGLLTWTWLTNNLTSNYWGRKGRKGLYSVIRWLISKYHSIFGMSLGKQWMKLLGSHWQ